jgi:hypothetical protein
MRAAELLRQARAYGESGQRLKAKAVYKTIIQEFAGFDQAATAAEDLEFIEFIEAHPYRVSD